MENEDKPLKKSELSRTTPPVMPMGFRIGITPEVIVVDLVDAPNAKESKIFYSIALTKESAKNLRDALVDFLEK
ncbi:hypothetical protein [Pseudomonas sp. Sample_24]|jgi:hypothetical protein|uniref:hypothetical protein n=1 Tax=Pseudomonas sp. Sample_24 TaxID=2448268 RepID=UPI001032ECFA|nr:hypothetical protein [Pseudomonas sp. Sample_24]